MIVKYFSSFYSKIFYINLKYIGMFTLRDVFAVDKILLASPISVTADQSCLKLSAISFNVASVSCCIK